MTADRMAELDRELGDAGIEYRPSDMWDTVRYVPVCDGCDANVSYIPEEDRFCVMLFLDGLDVSDVMSGITWMREAAHG